MPTAVLLVDDHEGFRQRARQLLERAGYTVVGEAATGAAAIQAITRLRPDAVLLDVQLPDMSGLAVARAASTCSPAPRVLLVSARAREEYGGQVDSVPAVGFLAKDELTGAALHSLLGAA